MHTKNGGKTSRLRARWLLLWDMTAMTLVAGLLFAWAYSMALYAARRLAESPGTFQCAVALVLFLRCLRAHLQGAPAAPRRPPGGPI